MEVEINLSDESYPKLRFGIICNGMDFETWQADCLHKLKSLGNVEIALIIIDVEMSNFSNNRKEVWNLWRLYWYLFVSKRSRALHVVDITPTLSGTPSIQCKTTIRETYSYFCETDIANIRKHDLDIILHLGRNSIRGDIVNIPPLGVWAFHHYDIEKYRGNPPAFWEIYLDDTVTGAGLYRITDNPEKYIPLRKGFFKTLTYSYVNNLDEVLCQSSVWPSQVCIDINNVRADYIHRSCCKASMNMFGVPDNVQMMFFFVKILNNVFHKLYRNLFYYEIWNIGIAESPVQDFLNSESLPSINWLPEGDGYSFKADPFAVCKDKKIHILVEEYDYHASKGFISLMTTNNTTVSPSSIVFKNSFHMSYPYLFEYNDQIYCVPETGEANEVSLYRAEEFPHRWTKAATLISNFSGIDSTVFQYEDRWWLFATELNDGFNVKLKVWYAPDLLGPWIPHAGNPVKMDVRSARPAGTPFSYDGCLYRPAQDCSRSYGGRVVINRVISLSPTEFQEEQAAVVGPYRNSRYPDGFHTISAFGGKTVVDGKRYEFVGKHPFMIYYNIKQKI